VQIGNIHLYDLKNDPLEENNIAINNPHIVEKMEAILAQLKIDKEFKFEESETKLEEENKIENELRKLGYIT